MNERRSGGMGGDGAVGSEVPDAHSVAAASHLSLVTMLELVDGELSPIQAEKARVHLLLCPDCQARAQSLLELPDAPADALIDAGPEPRQPTESERGRMLRFEPTVEPPNTGPRSGASLAHRSSSPGPVWLTAAAALVVGALAGFWLAPRTGRPAGLTAAASTQLLPQDFAVLGTLPATPAAACPPPGGAFVFVLGGLDASGEQGQAYGVELMGPSGAGLKIAATANRFGEIELALERSALANGTYRIVVRKNAKGDAAAREYRLLLDCP